MAKKAKEKANENIANLEEIVTLATFQVSLQNGVTDLEAALKDMKGMLLKVEMEDLPAALAEAGVSELTLEDGTNVKMKNDFSVAIPEKRRDEAYGWLEKNEYGGMIKTELVVSFGKGELEKAEKLAQVLLNKKLDVSLSQTVHWQTLKAWIKEMEENSKRYPSKLFGAFPLDKAIVKLPK